MAAAGARYIAQMALPPLFGIWWNPKASTSIHACCGNATRAPCLHLAALPPSKMRIPRYLARGKGICVFAWATACPRGGSFMYVPTRDHLCHGIQLEPHCLNLAGTSRPRQCYPPAILRVVMALASWQVQQLIPAAAFICAFISSIYVNLCAFIFQYSVCTSRRFLSSKMLISRGVARGEGTCVFAGGKADSSCGSPRVRACACAISFVPWKCNSSPAA